MKTLLKIGVIVLAVYAAYNWLKLHTVKQAVAAVDIDTDNIDVSHARKMTDLNSKELPLEILTGMMGGTQASIAHGLPISNIVYGSGIVFIQLYENKKNGKNWKINGYATVGDIADYTYSDIVGMAIEEPQLKEEAKEISNALGFLV